MVEVWRWCQVLGLSFSAFATSFEKKTNRLEALTVVSIPGLGKRQRWVQRICSPDLGGHRGDLSGCLRRFHPGSDFSLSVRKDAPGGQQQDSLSWKVPPR